MLDKVASVVSTNTETNDSMDQFRDTYYNIIFLVESGARGKEWKSSLQITTCS